VYRSSALVLIAFALTAFAGGARAGTEVRVLATHPAGDSATLGKNQTFYLRLGYTTDDPVKIWARPFFQGREVAAGSNPSRTCTGSGEALGWFFFMAPGERVDEIRISAGDGSNAGTQLVATHRVRITGSDRPAASTSEPGWLAALRQEDKRLQREEFEKRMNTPPGAGDTLIFGGFMLAVAALGIAGIAAPLWATRGLAGGGDSAGTNGGLRGAAHPLRYRGRSNLSQSMAVRDLAGRGAEPRGRRGSPGGTQVFQC
jgi:hypothetical protein